MIKRKIALALVLSLLMPVLAAAQSDDKQDTAKTEEEKRAREETEKKAFALMDEVIKEAASLRLPENRIRVQALAGDMLWKRDERRARALFKQATDGLLDLLAQTGSPLNIVDSQIAWAMQAREQLKQEVIQILSQRDARLARDFLHNISRPAQEEHADGAQAEEDTGQELRLALQITASDPPQAFQIAQESIPKGLSMELLPVFQQLKYKDAEMGEKLLAAIIKSLRSTNLTTNSTAASFAFSLLRLLLNSGQSPDGDDDSSAVAATQPAPAGTPIADERTIRELMEMVAAAALSNSASKDDDDEDGGFKSYLIMELGSMIKDVEKYAPSRAAQISKKIAELDRKAPPEERTYRQQEQVLSNGTVDEILESASKLPVGMRESFYQQAAMKAFGEGDETRARQIINENVSNPTQRDALLNNLNQQAMWRDASQGKVEETRQMLARIPPEQRATVMIQLANVLLGKGEKKIALQIIDEAQGMIGPQPSNFMEVNSLLLVARAYSNVAPARSFEIIEPIIDQINTLMAAAAVLDGFEYMRYFKDGELMPQSPGLLANMTMQCVRDTALLARIDFDRAKLAADRFQRTELRVMARLHVAQGVLSDKQPNQQMIMPAQVGSYTIGSYSNHR